MMMRAARPRTSTDNGLTLLAQAAVMQQRCCSIIPVTGWVPVYGTRAHDNAAAIAKCRRGTGTSSRARSPPATHGRSCRSEQPELPHTGSRRRARAIVPVGPAGPSVTGRDDELWRSTGTPRRQNAIIRVRSATNAKG